jgi:hypothetical protein
MSDDHSDNAPSPVLGCTRGWRIDEPGLRDSGRDAHPCAGHKPTARIA